MRNITKLILATFITALSPLVFAANYTTMNINFVNNQNSTGYAVAVDGPMIVGPILEKNGGKGSMSPLIGSTSIYPGFISASNGLPCQQHQQGYLALNPAQYTGDTITVTIQSQQNNDLECTCTGSACSFSIAAKQP